MTQTLLKLALSTVPAGVCWLCGGKVIVEGWVQRGLGKTGGPPVTLEEAVVRGWASLISSPKPGDKSTC